MKLDSIIRSLTTAALLAGAAWMWAVNTRIALLEDAKNRHSVSISKFWRLAGWEHEELTENAVLLKKSPLPKWPPLGDIQP